MFPWSEPGRYVSLRDDDEEELALVRTPSRLEPDSCAALEVSLAEAGFELDGYASFGKQVVLSKLARLAGKGAKYKVRYVVPRPFEGLLAQHFVWRLRRKG